MALALFCANEGFAQTQDQITSMQVVRQINEARSSMLVNPSRALALSQEAQITARAISGRDRYKLHAEAGALESQALLRMNRVNDAYKIITNIVKITNGKTIPHKTLGDIAVSRGHIEVQRGQVDIALIQFQNAFAFYQKSNEIRGQSIALQSLASLYNQGGDSRMALKYYAQADETFSGDPLLSLSAHNNIGNAYLSLFRPKEAEVEFRKALESAELLNSRIYTIRVRANIAKALIDQGRLSEAGAILTDVLGETDTSEFASELWAFWELRAQIAYRKKDYRAAGIAVEKALAGVDPAASSPRYRRAHDTAYAIYRATGRPAAALVHREAMARIDKESAELTASTAAALMAARFDSANQNLKIARLKAEQTEAESRSQRNLFIVSGIAGILLFVVLGAGLILITRSRNRERAAKLVLAQTNSDLERAMAAKMEFLATTSHEIRTPLNGILGMTQVLLTHRGLDSALRDRIGIVHSAGETMRALVDDILDVAKMETGKLAVQEGVVELPAMLRDVAQMWRLQAEAAGIDLVLDLDDCPDRIVGDAARIRQIVFNLMSNAMKFTESGAITLSARRVRIGEADRLRIAVRDSGIGIAAEWHESIFELFQQVDGGTTRKYGGTGLGLAICRNLARAMGGDVWVESMQAFGSTFTIDLPLVLRDRDIAPPTDFDAERSILIVERNPMTRGVLRAILSARFEAIEFVASLAEAQDLIRGQAFEWVLVDADSLDEDATIRRTEIADLTSGSSFKVLVIVSTADCESSLATKQIVLAKPLTKSMLVQAIGGEWGPAAADKPLTLAAAS
ncbi:MAG: ATP-binding protein [Sphingomonadaceae bacterium]